MEKYNKDRKGISSDFKRTVVCTFITTTSDTTDMTTEIAICYSILPFYYLFNRHL